MDYEPVLYRGIDFVLTTRKSARALTDELAKHIRFNRVWKGKRTIVMSSPHNKPGPEAEIVAFCRIIGGLSPQALACWNACTSRLIDIGIGSGNIRHGQPFIPLELKIGPKILKRIHDIGGQLVITVYPYVDGINSSAAMTPLS
jgi:hypothetical protein